MLYFCAMSRSVALHTLGCKLNFSETTTLGRMLEKEGFEQRPFESEADVYVINTCSVTDNADKECRQLVRRIRRRSPGAVVVITGCYAQLKPKEIAEIPGVNLVLGAGEKFNIAKHLKELAPDETGKIHSCDINDVQLFTPTHSMHERTRVFLKVQDGCDYNCSFCTIPLARGKSRSNRIEEVLVQVRTLEAAGVQEIVLTGINLGDFGKGIQGGKQKTEQFFDLMKVLDEETNIPRYRISSIEPNLITNEMISWVAKSRAFMPHFHIPLQSGSDEILGLMKRRYKRALYAERVDWIRKEIPHASIGVDVIVGFPGETEKHFDETLDFLAQLDITYLHVFTYSERENTLASSMTDVVPVAVRQTRNRILRQLSYEKSSAFFEKHIGQTRTVLFEGANKNGMMDGYTDNYISIKAVHNPDWENKLVDWTI
jgi:threonylcarbamoyladenosine tRNA methylthiotransferase MtaB